MTHIIQSHETKLAIASAGTNVVQPMRSVDRQRSSIQRALSASRVVPSLAVLVMTCGAAAASMQGVKVPKPTQETRDIKTPRPERVLPVAPSMPQRESSPTSDRSMASARTSAAAGATPSSKPEVDGPRPIPRLDPNEMLYDVGADGAVWVRGNSYKARIDGKGATYIPFLGANAPHNYPIKFALSSVRVGSEELPLASSAAIRTDDLVTIDRGTVVEQYVMRPDSMEQEFVLKSLSARGDLVLHMDVSTELDRAETVDGFEFANELGGMRYSRAVAIDANGNRSAAETVLLDGAIEIRVPAETLARAAFPLTIDPLGSTFTVTPPGNLDSNPDIAYDETHQVYAVTWERAFSTTDHDCYCQLQNLFGVTVSGSTVAIDFTGDYWYRPRIASNANSAQFLVVATVGLQGFRVIKGRTRDAGSTSMSAQFQISDPAITNDQLNADVGGDPTMVPPTYYFVTWERVYSPTDHDIFARRVDPSTALAPLVYVDNSADTMDTNPSISKCDGDEPFDTQRWTIVWQREEGTYEINGAQYLWDGSVVYPSFFIISSLDYLLLPCVSSITDGASGERQYLLAMEDQHPSNKDILCVLSHGNSVQTVADLEYLEGTGSTLEHENPHVDSDGCDFAVTYSVASTPGSGNFDVGISTVMGGNSIELVESHQTVASTPSVEGLARVTSRHSGGGGGPYYAVTWQDNFIPGSSLDILGCFYATPLVSSFCRPGVDTSLSCPCSNAGTTGHGCDNSAATGGAVMGASGAASLSEDNLKFSQSGELTNSTSILLQGGQSIASVAFGAGLRCVGGTLKRLYVHNASNGAVTMPSGSDASIHARSAGLGDTIGVCQSRYYQIYYRDSNLAFCNGSGFNVGDALSAIWVP